ncbi:hypothetical protein AAFN47_18730 [Hoeflea sp. CAU 1731]
MPLGTTTFGNSILDALEPTKMDGTALNADMGFELTGSLVRAYADIACSVACPWALVSGVLFVVRSAEIAPTVVDAVAVAMVDKTFGPFAFFH